MDIIKLHEDFSRSAFTSKVYEEANLLTYIYTTVQDILSLKIEGGGGIGHSCMHHPLKWAMHARALPYYYYLGVIIL